MRFDHTQQPQPRRDWWGDKSVLDCPYCFCRFGAQTSSRAVEWLNGHINARHKGGPLGDGRAIGKRRITVADEAADDFFN